MLRARSHKTAKTEKTRAILPKENTPPSGEPNLQAKKATRSRKQDNLRSSTRKTEMAISIQSHDHTQKGRDTHATKVQKLHAPAR